MTSLTVGIPVYNERLAIHRSIASVLNQSWKGKIEILVVDDGSSDGSQDAVRSLGNRYPQIKLICHKENMGRPAARSTLAANATGDWYAMLDADDEWYPDKLERQFNFINKIKASGGDVSKLMICGNIHHIDLDKRTERVKNFYEGYGLAGYDLARVLKGDNTPISQLAILPTAFMKKIGDFDPVLHRAQDWDFLIRFFRLGGRIEFLPSPPLAIFNFVRSGRNAEVVRQCMMAVIEKHMEAYINEGINPQDVKNSVQAYIDSFKAEMSS